MTVMRRLGATAVAVAATALGWAAPASADLLPPADGTYTYQQEGAPTALWQVQTICTQPNGTRAQPDYTDQNIQTLGCTVVLRSYTPQAPQTREERQFTFAARSRITDGMWAFQIPSTEGVVCPNGSTAPTIESFSFAPPDPAAPTPSVTGMRTSLHNAECGLEPGMVKAPFTLTYNSPLDPPVVSRFPAQCDYLVGRPSICS